MNKPSQNNYIATPDVETITWYMQLSAKDKLQWLEASTEFFNKALDTQAKQASQFFNSKV